MLVVTTIRSRARNLLNEKIEGFYLNTEVDDWISDAAIDISTKSKCFVVNSPLALQATSELYSLPVDTLEVISCTYLGVGLTRITVPMKGKQTAVPTGAPKYFYEITNSIGVVPVPTTTEVGNVIDLYVAQITSDITNIPVKFQTPAVLFVTSMGLIKSKQYDKATQLYNLYLNSLGLDRQDVFNPTVEQPPPQNQYVLKVALQSPPQG